MDKQSIDELLSLFQVEADDPNNDEATRALAVIRQLQLISAYESLKMHEQYRVIIAGEDIKTKGILVYEGSDGKAYRCKFPVQD